MDFEGPGCGNKKKGGTRDQEEREKEEAHQDLGWRREDHWGQALSC